MTKQIKNNTLWVGRRSLAVYTLDFISLSVVLIFSVIVSTNFFESNIPIILALIIILLKWISMCISHFTYLYIIENERLIERTGILSHTTTEIQVQDIRLIKLDQSLLGRILNYGTLHIATSGTSGIELQFINISDPENVRQIIRVKEDNI